MKPLGGQSSRCSLEIPKSSMKVSTRTKRTSVHLFELTDYNMSDTADKLERMATLLAKKLGPEHLANRQGGGGSKLTYIEGWRVISLANEVFGFNGWSSEVRDMNVDYVSGRTSG